MYFFWGGVLPQVWKGTNSYYFFIYFQLLVFNLKQCVLRRQSPALDRNRDMAPDPEPDSSTLSPSVTSIITSMVAASWRKRGGGTVRPALLINPTNYSPHHLTPTLG